GAAPGAMRLGPQQGVVDQLVEGLAAEPQPGRQRGPTQHLLEPTLQLLRLVVELAAGDALAVHRGDHVEVLLARDADAPADEGDREQRVEDLTTASGG